MIKIPSKCLISGGHSILKENNKGISWSWNNNFYCDYSIWNTDKNKNVIVINNKNLINNDYKIVVYKTKFKIVGNDNKYINSIFKVFFQIYKKFKLKFNSNYLIELYFDKYFYTLSNKNDKINLDNTPKNGLGSSSCFIVCLTKCLFEMFKFKYKEEFLYYSCLLINYYAQNKIGSGFDIQTCIYGSHLFINKYSKNIKKFEDYLFKKKFFRINKLKIKKLYIGNLYKILMAEVNVGTNTIKQVISLSKFLNDNINLKKKFYKISNKISQKIYENYNNLDNIKNENILYRNFIKDLSNKSKVDIEPDLVTNIIKVIENNIDIIYSIAPGAGGYDSIAFLIKKSYLVDLKKLELIIKNQLDTEVNLFILNIN